MDPGGFCPILLKETEAERGSGLPKVIELGLELGFADCWASIKTLAPDLSPSTYPPSSPPPPRQVSHTFSNYPPGVRYIWFQHGGVDTHYWAGWYGPRVTNSSITIGPPLP